MWSARFKRFKTLFVTAIFAEVSESRMAREIDYVNERLQNGFLISANSNSMSFSLTNRDPRQVRTQSVVRRSCEAY